MAIISEEVTIERDRVELLVRELQTMLEHKPYTEFKLRFNKDSKGQQEVVIIPHADPIKIVL